MKIHELLFYVAEKFVTVDELRFTQLQKDADVWYKDQLTKDNQLSQFLQKYGNFWLTQLACMYLSVFAEGWIRRYKYDMSRPYEEVQQENQRQERFEQLLDELESYNQH